MNSPLTTGKRLRSSSYDETPPRMRKKQSSQRTIYSLYTSNLISRCVNSKILRNNKIHVEWMKRIFNFLLKLQTLHHLEDNTIALANIYIQMYNGNIHYQLTRHPTTALFKERAIRHAKIIAIGSITVAAKVHECRTTNHLLPKFKKNRVGISKKDILAFESALLRALNWNLIPVTPYALVMAMLRCNTKTERVKMIEVANTLLFSPHYFDFMNNYCSKTVAFAVVRSVELLTGFTSQMPHFVNCTDIIEIENISRSITDLYNLIEI